jgi:F0F1-type ATP synthase assembly protein I
MNDIDGRGKRLVLRIAVAQLACTIVVAGLFALKAGWTAAGAAFAGGLIAVVGGAVFGLRMFAPGIAPAPKLAKAMYAAEGLKWIWILFAVWACLKLFKLPPGPLLTGLIVAQLGHWLGLFRFK